jgi:OOP family OmpA-OmpF porin
MKKIYSILSATALGVAALLSQPNSSAAETNGSSFMDSLTFYVGGSVGRSTVETGVSATTGTASLDEDDTGFKFFGGVNLNKYFSVEGFYTNLGEASLTGNNGDTFQFRGSTFAFTASANITVEGKAYGITPVLGYDVTERFRPFVKLGIQRWELDATVTSSSGSAALSDDGTDLVYGIGFLFGVTDNIAIRMEAERFKFDDANVDLLSIGAQVRF